MPSADLFLYFAAQPDASFSMLEHWRNSGNHYALTSEGWLQNMDANEQAVRAVFRDCYPDGEEVSQISRVVSAVSDMGESAPSVFLSLRHGEK
jgi:cyclopropane fatty-acyl-phospholipid synthase-like methyltransferase